MVRNKDLLYSNSVKHLRHLQDAYFTCDTSQGENLRPFLPGINKHKKNILGTEAIYGPPVYVLGSTFHQSRKR